MPSQGKTRLHIVEFQIHQCLLKEGEARPADLETIFFDFEVLIIIVTNFQENSLSTVETSPAKTKFQVGMEGEVCRDQVCLDSEAETQYLQVMSRHCC